MAVGQNSAVYLPRNGEECEFVNEHDFSFDHSASEMKRRVTIINIINAGTGNES